jgi:signal transduction histidine kinase
VELRTVTGGVQVRIQDSGPGIAAETLERIWEPDFTTKARGTGLGLALVRQTIRAHGGKVYARNHERGAEFRVLLPLESAVAPPERRAARVASSSAAG